MLEQVRQKADYTKLRAIKDGCVSILEVCDAWQNQALGKLDISEGKLTKPYNPFKAYRKIPAVLLERRTAGWVTA